MFLHHIQKNRKKGYSFSLMLVLQWQHTTYTRGLRLQFVHTEIVTKLHTHQVPVLCKILFSFDQYLPQPRPLWLMESRGEQSLTGMQEHLRKHKVKVQIFGINFAIKLLYFIGSRFPKLQLTSIHVHLYSFPLLQIGVI